jgi:hypothetical protein
LKKSGKEVRPKSIQPGLAAVMAKGLGLQAENPAPLTGEVPDTARVDVAIRVKVRAMDVGEGKDRPWLRPMKTDRTIRTRTAREAYPNCVICSADDPLGLGPDFKPVRKVQRDV